MNWIFNTLIQFLEDLNIDPSVVSLIDEDAKKLEEQFPKALKHPVVDEEIVYKILCEKYNLNALNVKTISETLNKEYKFGRNSKTALKKYLDYGKEEYLIQFFNTLMLENNTYIDREYIESVLAFCEPVSKEKIKNEFIKLWNEANEVNEYGKLKDYLLGIYSKLFSMGLENLRLIEIYNSNESLIKKVFKYESTIKELKEYCLSNQESITAGLAIKMFNEKYMELMKKEYQQDAIALKLEEHMNQLYVDNNINEYPYIFDRGNDILLLPTEEYDFVYFHIDQDFFNRFQDENKFLDYVLSSIKQIYRVLANEKVFALKIDNIYNNEKNLKWELYPKLTIYSEHFIQTKETARFYKAYDIAKDLLSKHEFRLLENDSEKNRENILKEYFSGKISEDELFSLVHVNMKKEHFFEFLNRFKYVHYGFTFNDCLVLDRVDKSFANGELENVISNATEILLIFYKFRADQRRIPCPSCGSLNISGNSYPEINNRSWECKSPYCPDRSKSNRGKRYSKKSNYMQWGAIYPKSHDIIPRELIKKWRRDIIVINNEQEIFEMLVKYFSFTDEKLLFINTNELPSVVTERENRKVVILSQKLKEKAYTSNVVVKESLEGEIEFFKNGLYLKNFTELYLPEDQRRVSPEINNFLNSGGRLKLIQGDSYEVLKSVEDNTFAAAVTSPPYYNAREYSQWPNLYLYFNDMYNIIKECFRTLKPGSVFLYNIADIVDNENIIVKSSMGNKRIPLGAYTIYFFQKAGFELLDNIIWDKGEPQSNRQKNDGKFTPHYQKPLNAYEHMFIFKKTGAPLTLSDDWQSKRGSWIKNIVPFQPVFKINSKGENILGHTAPFPEDIPRFVANVFTKHDNDIILDPFSGSLTSAIASYKSNRIGLGIELSPDYVELSRDRALLEGVTTKILNFN
uniref:Type II beta methyltransferase M.BslI n=1 Tax=Bacillus sp. (strain NEB-606) TaxID=114630 RepID=MTB1_BACSQ|nr:RecName: Full=Type II beta methyltransferase M.BslI; Short=M.BslI; AltName: Full=Modification methylase BslI; AltName: Full=N(4)- cytosine-specific methyltransferase BslI [Bacillus sp. NEB-606]AAF32529.1 BslIM [Bacillus sp. NEB-606]